MAHGLRRCTSFVSAVAVVAILSGCVAASEPSTDEPDVGSQWDAVLAQIDDTGTMPLEGALQAFSVAITPLPGVEMPSGDPEPVYSGTLAIDWLEEYWGELTAAQQAAATAVVPELGDGGETGTPTADPAAYVPRDEIDASYEKIAEGLFLEFLGKVGRSDPGWRPRVYRKTSDYKTDSSGWAYASPTSCSITIASTSLSTSALTDLMAHETFHCIEGILFGRTDAVGAWVREGAADWAISAASTYRGDPYTVKTLGGYWDTYLKHPQRSLFSRSYDAAPFFEYVGTRIPNLWQIIPRLVRDNAANLAILTAGDDDLRDWPAGFFRDASLGGVWEMSGEAITPTKPPIDHYSITNGETAPIHIAPAAVEVATLTASADIVTISGSGIGRIRFDDGTELDPGRSESFCALADGCACPQGTTPSITTAGQLPPGELRLAVTNAGEASDLTISGVPLVCTSVAEPVGSSPVGTWHLVDFVVGGASDGGDDITVTTSVTSGRYSLVVPESGPCSLDMAGVAMTAVTTGNGSVIDETTAPLNDGHYGPNFVFDRETHQITSQAGVTYVPGGPVPSPGVTTTVTWQANATSMTWVFQIEGHEHPSQTWHWARE